MFWKRAFSDPLQLIMKENSQNEAGQLDFGGLILVPWDSLFISNLAESELGPTEESTGSPWLGLQGGVLRDPRRK